MSLTKEEAVILNWILKSYSLKCSQGQRSQFLSTLFSKNKYEAQEYHPNCPVWDGSFMLHEVTCYVGILL